MKPEAALMCNFLPVARAIFYTLVLRRRGFRPLFWLSEGAMQRSYIGAVFFTINRLTLPHMTLSSCGINKINDLRLGAENRGCWRHVWKSGLQTRGVGSKPLINNNTTRHKMPRVGSCGRVEKSHVALPHVPRVSIDTWRVVVTDVENYVYNLQFFTT